MADDVKISVGIGARIKELTGKLNESAKKFDSWAGIVKKTGGDVTAGLTVPILGMASAAILSSKEATEAFTEFGREMKDIMGEVGDDLAEALDLEAILGDAGELLKEAVTWFTDLDDSTKRWVIALGAVLAASGPVILITGNLVAALASLSVLLTGPLGIVIGLGALAAGITAFAAVNRGLKVDVTRQRVKDLTKALGDQEKAFIRNNTAVELQTEQLQRTRKHLAELRAELKAATVSPGTRFNVGQVSEAEAKRLKKAVELNIIAIERQDFLLTESVENAKKEFVSLQRVFATSIPGDIFADFIGPLTELQQLERETFIDVKAGLDEIRIASELLGPSFNANAAELAFLESAWISLRASGVDPTLQSMQEVGARIEELRDPFAQFVAHLQETQISLVEFMEQTWDGFINGFANAVGRAIVFAEDLSTALMNVLKNLAAQVIATLVKLVAQEILMALLTPLIAKSVAAPHIAGSVARAGAAAAAASIETFGLVGIALAPGFALAGIAAAVAGATLGGATGASATQGIIAASAASAPVPSAAKGGLFLSDTLIRIADVEPEIALTRSNIRQFFDAGGMGMHVHVHTNINGREAAEEIVVFIPGVLKMSGAS